MNVWYNIKQMKFNEELVCGLRRIISEPYTMFICRVYVVKQYRDLQNRGEN